MSDETDFDAWLASKSPEELRREADEHDREIWYQCIDLGSPTPRCLLWPYNDPCCGMVSAVTGEWLGICPPPRPRTPKGGVVKKALIREWMADCTTCVALVDALNAAEAGPALVRLKAFEEVRAHLVEVHLALLPEYADDCGNCQEWKVVPGYRSGLAAKVLAHEALLHRAGHLLYDEKV